jgi:uncharacterized protein YchJ
MRILIVVTIMISTAYLFGCSSGIDDKFVGQYLDEKNPSLYIQLNKDGSCAVVSNSGRNSSRMFWCSISEPSISMKLMRDEIPTDEGVIYPEFRGSSAVLTLDRNTLITQTGRRFTKKGFSSSTQTNGSKASSTDTIISPTSVIKKVHQSLLNCDYDSFITSVSVRLIAKSPPNKEVAAQQWKEYQCTSTIQGIYRDGLPNAEFRGETIKDNTASVHVRYAVQNIGGTQDWQEEKFVKEDGQWKYIGGGLFPELR